MPLVKIPAIKAPSVRSISASPMRRGVAVTNESPGVGPLEELQKGIQGEDQKHQPKQLSHNPHDDFYANVSVKFKPP